MSFYTDASLVMIPSGYKDGKVYSAKPVDGSGDLDFSRGSDIEATRVNANGYIEKAKVNLLLQSNTFSNASWVALGASVTSGQSGYDGTSDAWLLSKGGASGRIYQNISFNSVATFSVYAKAASNDWIWISENNGVGSYFDLGNGVVGTTTSGLIERKIEDIGGGWYRCSITAAFNFANIRIYPADGDGDTSGTSGTIYIQDAQLNYGLVAQTYQETTTAAVVSGITDNMPRLNYDPANPTCPSLLLEPSRTNVVTDSEYFGNWANDDLNLSFNASTSPEGVINATNAIPNTSNVIHRLRDIVSIASSASVTFSVFAKANGYNFLFFRENSSGSYVNTFFDLANGTTSDTGASIQDYGGGWYRCILTATSAVTSATLGVGVSNANGTTVFTGNGTSGVLLYGAQVESSASYPSSYIPSYGSSATRTAESAYKTSATAIIGQTEGTMFAEIKWDGIDADRMFMTLSDGTTSNRMHIGYDATGNRFYFNIKVSGAQEALVVLNNPTAGNYKIAAAYKQNDVALYINGAQADVDTSTNIAATSQINVGGYISTGFQHPVKQALLFKTRLSNSELATLTA